MAGLLDFSGWDQQGGLLNQPQQPLDWRTILQKAGDFGAGLLQASGPSMSPVAPSWGQMLGAGVQSMQAGDQNRQAGAFRDMQAKVMGQQFQQNQMTMDATKRKQDANTRLAQAFAPTQVADASGQIGYSSRPMNAAEFLKDQRNFAMMVEAGHDPLQLMQAIQKPDDTVVLPEGSTLARKSDGSTVAQGGTKKTEFERELDTLYPDPNDPRRVKIMEDYVKRKGQGPQTNVNVVNKAGGSLANEIGPIVSGTQAAAMSAIDTIDTIGRIRGAMGTANLGPTATLRTMGDRVANVLGGAGASVDERLANSRTVVKGLAELTLNGRKALKGQGQVSDYEGKLLERASSGDIDNLTVPELKTILDVSERIARRQYSLHENQLTNMKNMPETAPLAPFYAVPPLTAPSAKNPSGLMKGQTVNGYKFKGGNPTEPSSWEPAN